MSKKKATKKRFPFKPIGIRALIRYFKVRHRACELGNELRKLVHQQGCKEWMDCPEGHEPCSKSLNAETAILWEIAETLEDWNESGTNRHDWQDAMEDFHIPEGVDRVLQRVRALNQTYWYHGKVGVVRKIDSWLNMAWNVRFEAAQWIRAKKRTIARKLKDKLSSIERQVVGFKPDDRLTRDEKYIAQLVEQVIDLFDDYPKG